MFSYLAQLIRSQGPQPNLALNVKGCQSQSWSQDPNENNEVIKQH